MGQKCGIPEDGAGLIKCGAVDDSEDEGFFEMPAGFKEPAPTMVVPLSPKEPESVAADRHAGGREEQDASAAAAAAAAREVHREAEAAQAAAAQRRAAEEAAQAEAARKIAAEIEAEQQRAEARRAAEAEGEARRQAEPQDHRAAEPPAMTPQDGLDAASVSQLLELGFTEPQARDALLRNGGNVEQALSLLLGGDAGPAPPPLAERSQSRNAAIAIPGLEDKVAQLTAMGFRAGQVRRKLQDANGDVDLAMTMLLSDT